MKPLTQTAKAPVRGSDPVSEEIAMALQQHRKSARGLIIGLEKFRQLRACTTYIAGSYQGISLIIDASHPLRITVF